VRVARLVFVKGRGRHRFPCPQEGFCGERLVEFFGPGCPSLAKTSRASGNAAPGGGAPSGARRAPQRQLAARHRQIVMDAAAQHDDAVGPRGKHRRGGNRFSRGTSSQAPEAARPRGQGCRLDEEQRSPHPLRREEARSQARTTSRMCPASQDRRNSIRLYPIPFVSGSPFVFFVYLGVKRLASPRLADRHGDGSTSVKPSGARSFRWSGRARRCRRRLLQVPAQDLIVITLAAAAARSRRPAQAHHAIGTSRGQKLPAG